jgi:azurin
MSRILLAILTVSFLAAGSARPAAQASRKVHLTGNDSLQYSLATITARPGERLTVVLRTFSMQPASQMAHNFVLLKPGSDVNMFVMEAGMARDTDFLPPKLKSQVLVASALAGPGETVEVTFTAPARPGTYTYLCTYPGHYSGGMKGVLIVK